MATGEIERRFIPRGAGEVRAKKADDGTVGIGGTGAVFDTLSDEIFGFREKIAVGAFDKALKKSDVRGLFNHDPNMILGRVKAGTMSLRADKDGFHYDIPALPAARGDVAEAVQRGDVTGNSFSFTVAKDEWEYDDHGPSIRTITEFEEVFDVGPVVFPAYPATQVSARAKAMAGQRAESPRDVPLGEAPPPTPDAPNAELRRDLPNFALEHEKILLAEIEQDIAS